MTFVNPILFVIVYSFSVFESEIPPSNEFKLVFANIVEIKGITNVQLGKLKVSSLDIETDSQTNLQEIVRKKISKLNETDFLVFEYSISSEIEALNWKKFGQSLKNDTIWIEKNPNCKDRKISVISWKNIEGKPKSVEFFLNGKSMGKSTKGLKAAFEKVDDGAHLVFYGLPVTNENAKSHVPFINKDLAKILVEKHCVPVPFSKTVMMDPNISDPLAAPTSYEERTRSLIRFKIEKELFDRIPKKLNRNDKGSDFGTWP